MSHVRLSRAGARPARFIALCLIAAAALSPILASPPAVAASGTAALVIDVHSGRTLYARNADAPRYPASLTKIMTLYVLFDFLRSGRIEMHTPLVATANAAAQSPSKIGIKPGETIRVIDAIRVLVTKSANDVAVVVAENLGGTEENFARMMTSTARRLGMNNTTFKNASGLPDPGQISTARDMSILALRVMRDFPEYYELFSTKYFSYAGQRYRNHNRLLFDYEGTDGIKTGYTRASGFNLVASVKRDHRHLVGVVLGGKTAARRNATMRHIIDSAIPKALALNTPRNVPAPTRNPVAVADAAAPAPMMAGVATASLAPAAPPPVAAAPTAPAETSPVEEGDAASTAYQVQVGAYGSAARAAAQLASVQKAAGDLVGDHPGLTVPTDGRARPLYRARFANFSEPDANSVCTQLKRREIDCIVMPAE